MTMIRESGTDGLPIGSYDVFYYHVTGGRLVTHAGFDRDVSEGYVSRLTLRPGELAEVVCQSQPGGAWFFGSPAVKEAAERVWRRAEAEAKAAEAARRKDEAAKLLAALRAAGDVRAGALEGATHAERQAYRDARHAAQDAALAAKVREREAEARARQRKLVEEIKPLLGAEPDRDLPLDEYHDRYRLRPSRIRQAVRTARGEMEARSA